jgi:CheY-like chemotaxis protein
MGVEKKTVLIVDDNQFFVSQQIACLGRERFDIHTASSGREGLDKVHLVNPDIILLDHIMEDMTGPEVCRVLKADPFTAHIPIIIISSAEREPARLQTASAGCDGILFKPIRRNQLIGLVEEFLGISNRNWVRASASLPCTTKCNGTRDMGTIHSLSGGGAFVESGFPLLTGDTCQLQFSLPDAVSANGKIDVREAMVVWVGKLKKTDHLGAGFKFLTISQDDQESIDRYATSFPDPEYS